MNPQEIRLACLNIALSRLPIADDRRLLELADRLTAFVLDGSLPPLLGIPHTGQEEHEIRNNEMDEYQKRVVEEKRELDTKRTKLG